MRPTLLLFLIGMVSTIYAQEPSYLAKASHFRLLEGFTPKSFGKPLAILYDKNYSVDTAMNKLTDFEMVLKGNLTAVTDLKFTFEGIDHDGKNPTTFTFLPTDVKIEVSSLPDGNTLVKFSPDYPDESMIDPTKGYKLIPKISYNYKGDKVEDTYENTLILKKYIYETNVLIKSVQIENIKDVSGEEQRKLKPQLFFYHRFAKYLVAYNVRRQKALEENSIDPSMIYGNGSNGVLRVWKKTGQQIMDDITGALVGITGAVNHVDATVVLHHKKNDWLLMAVRGSDNGIYLVKYHTDGSFIEAMDTGIKMTVMDKTRLRIISLFDNENKGAFIAQKSANIHHLLFFNTNDLSTFASFEIDDLTTTRDYYTATKVSLTASGHITVTNQQPSKGGTNFAKVYDMAGNLLYRVGGSRGGLNLGYHFTNQLPFYVMSGYNASQAKKAEVMFFGKTNSFVTPNNNFYPWVEELSNSMLKLIFVTDEYTTYGTGSGNEVNYRWMEIDNTTLTPVMTEGVRKVKANNYFNYDTYGFNVVDNTTNTRGLINFCSFCEQGFNNTMLLMERNLTLSTKVFIGEKSTDKKVAPRHPYSVSFYKGDLFFLSQLGSGIGQMNKDQFYWLDTQADDFVIEETNEPYFEQSYLGRSFFPRAMGATHSTSNDRWGESFFLLKPTYNTPTKEISLKRSSTTIPAEVKQRLHLVTDNAPQISPLTTSLTITIPYQGVLSDEKYKQMEFSIRQIGDVNNSASTYLPTSATHNVLAKNIVLTFNNIATMYTNNMRGVKSLPHLGTVFDDMLGLVLKYNSKYSLQTILTCTTTTSVFSQVCQ